MLAEHRALRLAIAAALALATAYGLAIPLPFLAPVFVVILSTMPGPPMGAKALLVLVLVMCLGLGSGLLLIPMLAYYPVTAILTVALGLFLAMYITLILGKRVPGMFLTIGFTLISVAGTVDYLLAITVIQSLALALIIAVVCQWVVYPFFPELPGATPAPEAAQGPEPSAWFALRAALIVLPAYLLALTNPSQYLMTIMKSVSLGQQSSMLDARHAGRELIGSTFVGGIMAVLFWVALKVNPTLWMFFLWMLAFGLYASARLYRARPSSFAPSFWVNALVTMLILLGPAVEDSANGNDAASAFAMRFVTFVAVTFYAWGALYLLEYWRSRRLGRAAMRGRAVTASR